MKKCYIIGLILILIPSLTLATPTPKYSFSLWAGSYCANEAPLNKAYTDNTISIPFIEASYKINNCVESSIGIALAYKFDGYTVDESLKQSIDNETIKMAVIPCYLQANYFYQKIQDQLLVPYVGAGLDAWYYKERVAGERSAQGIKSGYHGLIGAKLLLDRIDPKAAPRMKEFGINNTYLALEMRYNKIDNFGDSALNLSGPIYKVGILVEF